MEDIIIWLMSTQQEQQKPRFLILWVLWYTVDFLNPVFIHSFTHSLFQYFNKLVLKLTVSSLMQDIQDPNEETRPVSQKAGQGRIQIVYLSPRLGTPGFQSCTKPKCFHWPS